MSDVDPLAPPTVRFGRRQRRGFFLGFSTPRVICIGFACLVLTGPLLLGGAEGLVTSAPLWVCLLLLAFVHWGDRPAIETAPTAGHFAVRRAIGQTSYRARPSSPRPAGTLGLPGDAAPLRFHLDEPSGAAMVHDPYARTLTAVAVVRHPAFVLLSGDEQSRRVDGWARALAGLTTSGSCARIQVLETALPDDGDGIARWWRTHGTGNGSQWASTQYARLVEQHAPAASTHRTLVALSTAVRPRGRHTSQSRRIDAAADALRQDMTGLEMALREAGLELADWLPPTELASILRSAFTSAPETSHAPTPLELAGPVAVEEHWDHLRHDDGYSAVLWISEWPRVDVPPSFLHALVFQPGVRKTISITATALPAEEAMRDIRREKVEYLTDSAQKARLGVMADLSDDQELHDVIDRERALIAGHTDLRFTGLVAVTAPTREALASAVAQVERAATQCCCETRVLYGQQARAFLAAALPLARKVD